LQKKLPLIVDKIDTSAWVDLTKLFLQSKKLSAHSVWRKIFCSIGPTIDSPDFRQISIENLPNLWSVCQISALFANHCLPKKLFILFARKSSARMLVKLTPQGLCDAPTIVFLSFASHKLPSETSNLSNAAQPFALLRCFVRHKHKKIFGEQKSKRK